MVVDVHDVHLRWEWAKLSRHPVVNESPHRVVEQDSGFIYSVVYIAGVQGDEDRLFVVVDPHRTSAHDSPAVERVANEFGRTSDRAEIRPAQRIPSPPLQRITFCRTCNAAAIDAEPTKDTTLAPVQPKGVVSIR